MTNFSRTLISPQPRRLRPNPLTGFKLIISLSSPSNFKTVPQEFAEILRFYRRISKQKIFDFFKKFHQEQLNQEFGSTDSQDKALKPRCSQGVRGSYCQNFCRVLFFSISFLQFFMLCVAIGFICKATTSSQTLIETCHKQLLPVPPKLHLENT